MRKLAALLLLLAATPLLFAQKAPNFELGFKPEKLYQFGDLESVNLFNGNMIVRLPIGPAYPIGGSLSHQLTLNYNSKVWDYRAQEVNWTDAFGDTHEKVYWQGEANARSNAGLGWRLSLGRLLAPTNATTTAVNQHGWLYEAPDGGEYSFFPCRGDSAASDGWCASGAPAEQDVEFSDSNSNLRMVKIDSDHRNVEFPDGAVHTFKKQANRDWLLERIGDRFGNSLTVDYAWNGGTVSSWTLKNGQGVVLEQASFERWDALSNSVDDGAVLTSVSYRTPNNSFAQIAFHHSASPGTPVALPCGDERLPGDSSTTASLPLLESIELPASAGSFSFSYNLTSSGENCASGTLASMTLPTGGRTDYGYGSYTLPYDLCYSTPALAKTPGLVSKTTPDGTWRYVQALGPAWEEANLPGGNGDQVCSSRPEVPGGAANSPVYNQPVHWSRTSVISPAAMNSAGQNRVGRSDSYFSATVSYHADPLDADGVITVGVPYVSGRPVGANMRGNPKTVLASLADVDSRDPVKGTMDGGFPVYLSMYEFGDCEPENGDCTNGILLRSTWRGAGTGPAGSGRLPAVPRSTKVVSEDGTTGCSGPCYQRTDLSDWSGFAFRRSVMSTSTASGVTQTRTEIRNLDSWTDPVKFKNNSLPWILGLDTYVSVQDGAQESRTYHCYDATNGFLKRQRTLATVGGLNAPVFSAKDLLVDFDQSNGNVTEERHFGGDLADAGVPSESSVCGQTNLGNPQYRVHNEYTSTGVLTKSFYSDPATAEPTSLLNIVDRTVDPDIGLVKIDRDAAGRATGYQYDDLIRVKSILPPGSGSAVAATAISYWPASATALASAEVIQALDITSTADPLADTVYVYDKLGRIIKKRSKTATGSWSAQWTKFDALGRVSGDCLPGPDSAPPDDHRCSQFFYDGLGRKTRIVAPDGSATTMAYDGRRTTRTSKVTTALTGTESDAVTQETYDGFGRLIQVDEPSPGARALYTYDLADHLQGVSLTAVDSPGGTPQTRAFIYDGRGALLTETQPEWSQQTATYAYDALGHLISRTGPGAAFDLSYAYDRRGLLSGVSAGSGATAAPLKTFTYGLDGRILSAARHNRVPRALGPTVDDFVITETYSYDSITGRPSTKETTLRRDQESPVQTFKQTFAFDFLGETTRPGFPACKGAPCGRGVESLDALEYSYSNGFLRSVPGFATSIDYFPSGLLSKIDHGHGVVTTQTEDPNGRLSSIAVGTFQPACDSINIVQQPQDAFICGGAPTTLSIQLAPAPTPLQVEWYRGMVGDRTNQIETGLGTDGLSVAVQPSVTSQYWARISTTDGGCAVNSQTALVTVASSLTVIKPLHDDWLTTRTTQTTADMTAEIVVDGAGPFTYDWVVTGGTLPETTSHIHVSAGHDTLTVSVPANGTRTVSVTVTDHCGRTVSAGPAVLHAVVLAIGTLKFNTVGSVLAMNTGSTSTSVTLLVDDAVIVQDANALPSDLNPRHTFEWFRNGQSLGAASIDPSLAVSASSPYSVYQVRVRKEYGSGVIEKWSDSLYVYKWGSCPSSPVKITPSVTVLDAGATGSLEAITEWAAEVTYQWYEGDLGNTEKGVASVPGFPNRIAPSHAGHYWVRVTNVCGQVQDSAVATVYVNLPDGLCAPVSIASQSDVLKAAAGTNVELAVDASSNEAVTYEWSQWIGAQWVRLASQGASGRYRVNLKETTRFQASVANRCASALSRPITVRITSCGDNYVVTQPASQQVASGSSFILSVGVSHSANVTYKWFVRDADGTVTELTNGVSGSTLTAVAGASATYFARMAVGDCSFDSDDALVTICTPAAFNSLIANYNIVIGNGTYLHARAVGTGLTYKWYIGSGASLAVIPGADGPDFWAHPNETTTYTVEIADSCSGNAPVRATVQVSVCPTSISQPVAAPDEVMPGATTSLSVTAEGSQLHYQWYVGGSGTTTSPIANSNAATITSPPVTAASDYWVQAKSGDCGISSATVHVRLCSGVSAAWGATGRNLHLGESFELSVLATPTPSAGGEVRWYSGTSGDVAGSILLGSGSEVARTVLPQHDTSYWARVYRANCYADTPTLTLHVCVPTVTTQPAAATLINSGGTATLTFAADTDGVIYQWYIGSPGSTSAPLAGETHSQLVAHPSVDTTYWARATSSCGITVDSTAAVVTICQPPAITVVPPNRSVQLGTEAMIDVTATGTSLSYQWYQGTAGTTTTPLQTGSVLRVTPSVPTDYWVKVTGSCGSVNSSTAHVSVCTTPTITTQPVGTTIFSGASAHLTVTASESTGEPMTYQWYRGSAGDTAAPVGTNAPYFDTPALTTATAYWVRVSAGICSAATSQAATISVCPLPQTLAAPANVQAAVNQSVQLSAPGFGTAQYRWYREVSPGQSTSISSWSSNPFVNVQTSVDTRYWAEVSSGGCVSSTGMGTVYVCIPTFSAQPASVTLTQGSSTTLTSLADTVGVTYQWYTGLSGTTTSPITGQTASSLTITPSSTSNYWVRATGNCGRTADSQTATVTICIPPTITSQPASLNVSLHAGASMTVTATGSTLSYQWYRGATGDTSSPVSGQTAATLSISNVSATTSYWVRVSNVCGAANSNAAWLSIAPVINSNPQGTSMNAGSTAILAVDASGTALHYTWKYGSGTAVTGAPDAPTFIASVTTTTTFYCAVTSGTATTNSQGATVAICTGPVVPSMNVSTGAPGCHILVVPIDWQTTWSHIRWYKGQRGDTSVLMYSDDSSYNACSAGTYWARVVSEDGSCYTDSNAVTFP
jgi:YD repeat-containing protein